MLSNVICEGFDISLDLSKQVIGIDVIELPPLPEAIKNERHTFSVDRLYPRAVDIGTNEDSAFVPLSVMLAKTKSFNDSLMATVEILLQGNERNSEIYSSPDIQNLHNKSSSFMGKREILARIQELIDDLRGSEAINRNDHASCHTLLAASALLGGKDPREGQSTEVVSILENFESNSMRSKPIGFYTWSSELIHIFKQDRLLQSELTSGQADVFKQAIEQDQKLCAEYLRLISLWERLANPMPSDWNHPLDSKPDSPSSKTALFPPARSHETELMKRLYGLTSIPDEFTLIDEVVKRIRDGSINLQPSERSGWYDYVTYTLEPLVAFSRMEGNEKLLFNDEYRCMLEDMFKGALAQARETFVKQLEFPILGSALFPLDRRPKIVIQPRLHVEPVPELYLRTAHMYKFVQNVLLDYFGLDALKGARRFTPLGRVSKSLVDEMTFMIELMCGAHCRSCRDLGIPLQTILFDGTTIDEDHTLQVFDNWMERYSKDPDLSYDQRMMVPIFRDRERGMIRAWVFLGYREKDLTVFFETNPTVVKIEGTGSNLPSIEFGSYTLKSAYPVTKEIYVKKLLDREEFQELCNRFNDPNSIIKELQA